MGSGPIISWKIIEETMETVTGFIFLGSKITADDDCSHEVKRHLLLGKKSYNKPTQHIKSWDITFPTKIHIVKAMVFPVLMDGCESWIIKQVVCQRIDAFELWCWRRLLQGDQTSQSYTLAPWWEELTHCKIFWWKQRAKSLGKTLKLQRWKASREGDNRGQDGWMASLTQWTWVWANSRR